MKKILLSSVALFAITGTAVAADLPARMPVKAPPIMAPAFSWTGCYIGANVGWIGSDGDIFTHPGPPASYGGQNFNPSPNSHTYSGDGSSVTGGGQIGCNWQTGIFVFGVEADGNGTGLDWTQSASYPAIVQTNPAATTWTAHTETVTSQLPWYATFRGRAGITVGEQSLIYVTGGLVVGKVEASLDYNSLTAPFRLTGSASDTRTGWTIGGGWEWAWTNNWSFKAEYLYLDFGDFSFLAPNVVPGGGDTRTWAVDVHERAHVARVGVNYRFGGR